MLPSWLTCRPNPAVARLETHEAIDAQSCILIICGQLLLNFPCITFVRSGAIIGESFGSGEFMVAAGGSDNIPVPCYLTCKALDRAGDCEN